MYISKKWITFICVIAFVASMSSMFWTSDVAYKQEDLSHMEFGWPVRFIIQNQSMYTPVYFPEDFRINIPQETPTRFLYPSLLLNFIIHLFLLMTLFVCVKVSKKYSPFN